LVSRPITQVGFKDIQCDQIASQCKESLRDYSEFKGFHSVDFPTAGDAVERYFQSIQELQRKIIETQKETLVQVATRMAETIRRDRRILTFGTGHSHMLSEEGFFRAGGLAAVVPIFSSVLMLHENADISSKLERTAGLARLLLEAYEPLAGEMLFIFSNSGVNRLPVEMALEAKERGLFVVSISSLKYARTAPLSDLGNRLDEIVDVAIDNGGEPGDALLPVEGVRWRVGPSSTITGALIWNSLVVETVAQLVASGDEAPVIASLNMQGAQSHNQKLLEKWRTLNPHL
jgi:uncharacterized phosphosugar-binding protein